MTYPVYKIGYDFIKIVFLHCVQLIIKRISDNYPYLIGCLKCTKLSSIIYVKFPIIYGTHNLYFILTWATSFSSEKVQKNAFDDKML